VPSNQDTFTHSKDSGPHADSRGPEKLSVSLTVFGYGHYRTREHLTISTNEGDFCFNFRFKPYYANWFHALDELIVEDTNYFQSNGTKRLLLRLKRSISIGISRNSHFAGLWNGFMATVHLPENITFFQLVPGECETLHISRTASNSGVVLSDFSREMERSVRRSPRGFVHFITSIVCTKDQAQEASNSFAFPNLIRGISAVKHYKFNYKNLSGLDQSSLPVNQYFQILQAIITPQGLIANKLSRNSIEVIEGDVCDYWPSPLWRDPTTQEYLSPTVKGCIRIKEPASYIGCSTNWAHFVEDNLPSILGLTREDISRPIYIAGFLSNIQMETLRVLFPDSTFIIMQKEYNYEFDNVIINIHQDSRNEMIQGIQSNRAMVDFENLSQVRERAANIVAGETPEALKVFISRTGGFRPLINKKKIESIFRQAGFLIISAESLGFVERLKLFRKASVVAGETGAGLVNLYFCKAGTKLIELRHPNVKNSLEHLAMLKLTDHKYQVISGRKVSAVKKLRFGVDSYYVDEEEVTDVLSHTV